MAITDQQVAALRAQLAGDVEEHQRLLEQLDPATDNEGYATLLVAALFEAARRRFGNNSPHHAEVVEFVGDLRSRAEVIRQRLSADAAERVIMVAYDKGSIRDLDDETVRYAQAVIAVAIISDEQLTDEGLDAFMAEVRSVAEQVLA